MAEPLPSFTVTRSGDLYLVQRGPVGRLVDTVAELTYPPARVASILAHSAVSHPWEAVAPEDAPDIVRAAGASLPGSLPGPE